MEMDNLLDSSPLYVEKMGLNCADPFAEQPVPLDLIYRSTARAHQLNFLQHLCQFSQYILMVVGPEGSGKSTLKRLFIEETKSQLKICEIRAQEVHTVPILLQTIAERFDLPWDPQNGNLEQTVAETLTQDWRPWVMVVDDAESLRADVLEAILKLLRSHTVRGEPLHLVLFGEPGLQNLLNLAPNAELSADALHRLDLEMLDEEELKPYINFSLQKAGYKGEYLISAAELLDIQDEAKGVYSETNRVIRQQMMLSLRKTPHSGLSRFNLYTIKPQAALVAGAAILGVGLYLASDNIKSFLAAKDTQVQTQAISFNTDTTTQQPAVPTTTEATPQPVADQVAADQGQPIDPMLAASALPVIEETVVTTVIEENLAQVTNPSSSENIDAALMPETSLPILSFTEETVTIPVEIQRQETVIIPSQAAEPFPVVAATNEAPVEIQQEQVFIPEVKEEVASAPKRKEKAIKKVEAKKVEVKKIEKAEKTVVSQGNSQHYTLQLMGLSDKQSLNKLLANHKDKSLSYYETTRAGKPWYVVTYGDFTDSKKAKVAAANLPADLKQSEPWTRTFASIEKEKQKHR